MKFNRLASDQTWENFVLLNAIDTSNNGPMFCSTNPMVRIISFVICFYRKKKKKRKDTSSYCPHSNRWSVTKQSFVPSTS